MKVGKMIEVMNTIEVNPGPIWFNGNRAGGDHQMIERNVFRILT